MDLAVTNWDSGSVSVLLGNGDGTFQAPVSVGGCQGIGSIATGELNGDGHPDLAKIESLGYHVLSAEQRQIGALCQCLRRWTDNEPSAEVIHDAIEEYLAV